ncbi:MAG: type VI secretion system tip protein VgrG [Deltaproteobacteria bacterium]|nr:type VI secretion system tip protein VgrG [Deltaproteobacteria bacterium]
MSLLTKKKYSFISRGMDKETFTVVSFKGVEAISRPYEFEITLVSDHVDIDPLKVLQNPAVFTILRDAEENVDFNGILMQFEETREFDGFLFFKAVLSPKLWWLSLTHHNQVFLDSTVPEIMEAALKDGGLVPGIDFEFRLQNIYLKHEYVCQYDESHFNFISRWAQREGIYYFFEQTASGEKVVFTDTKISHKDLLLGKDLFYVPPSALDSMHTKEVVKNFLCRHNMLPSRVYLKDYNYLKPSLAIEGIADVDENGRGENYIYGEHFDTPEEGNRLARIRAEALLCRKSVFIGESSVPFIVPGYTFDLNDHYKDAYNRKYLVTDATHEGHQTGYLISGISTVLEQRDEQMFYSNTFTAIYSDEQFRPEHISRKPKISGTINAKIDAASSGQYAELDEHGRYKVILPFDRSGRFNGKASAWFRMVQPYAGQNQGMHFPLHKGTEVLLTFIDGNPDRPLIAGAVPNPETSSPVTSGNQTKSVIRTGRSPVDGSAGAASWQTDVFNYLGNNFIELDDAQNNEHVSIHSPGNFWREAQDRYGEYHAKEPATSLSQGSEPKIDDLLDNFGSQGSYKPTGMLDRHNTNGAQADFYDDVFKNAHVHVSSLDTVTTQEGNIYDFGGYWNYNLGNCYVEEHLDQAAELNRTRPQDLLDAGGPSWTMVDWNKGLDSRAAVINGPSGDDIEIGSPGDWSQGTAAGSTTNVWVTKQFGRSYTYSEVDSIEVTKGSSLSVQYGGRHVDVGFRGNGKIKSWSWSDSGVKKEKKWTSDGTLIYDMDSSSATGVTNETSWNRFTKNMVSQSTRNISNGVTSESKYCMDSGNLLSYSSKHQGFNSFHSFDFNWANTASASFTFAAGTSFSFKMAANLDLAIYAAMDTSISAYAAGKIDIKAYAAIDLGLSAYAAAKFDFSTYAGFKLAAELSASLEIDFKFGTAVSLEFDLRNTGKITYDASSGTAEVKVGGVVKAEKAPTLAASLDVLRLHM